MIITVTPNPALDRTFELGDLAVGEVNRAIATRVDAGGKGLNISRALRAQGLATVAVFPASGNSGEELVAALDAFGIPAKTIEMGGETRSNVTLVDALGITTKINAPGPPIMLDAEAALFDAIKEVVKAKGHPVIVGAGNLPPGASVDFYAKLSSLAAELGCPMALDTSGQPLALAVKAGGLTVVKPNLEELAEITERPLVTVGDVVSAAREILSYGNHAVLVSLGAAGALLVIGETWAWAGGPPLLPLSTVGAGDMTLAGYLSALPCPMPSTTYDVTTDFMPELAALKAAVTWGRAATLQPGTAAPKPADLRPDEVRVIIEPDLATLLGDL